MPKIKGMDDRSFVIFVEYNLSNDFLYPIKIINPIYIDE